MTIAHSSAQNLLVNLAGGVPEAGAEPGAGAKAAQGITDDTATEVGGFWSMLSQNLSRVLAEGDQQSIENKEILAAIGEFENALQDTAEEQLPAQWMHVLKSHFSELLDGEEIIVDDQMSDQERLITDPQPIPAGVINVAIQQAMIAPEDGRGLPPGRQQLSESMILPIVQKQIPEPHMQPTVDPVNRLAAEVTLANANADADLDMEFAQRFTLESAKATELPSKLQSGLLASAESISTLRAVDGTSPSQLTAGALATATTASSQQATLAAEARVLPGTLSTAQPQWGSALGERISFMINQHLNSAEIRVDPPQLGKLDIQIQVKDDAATIVIHTQNAQTRDLVDAASVRLREYLQEAGYQSVDVNVSHQDSSSGHGELADRAGNGETAQDDQASDLDLPVAESGTVASVMVNDGRIDYFA